MKSELAPVVLFVYNRPWHAQQTIEALQRNELSQDTNLFIFSDGPKYKKAEESVRKTREYIKTIKGFKSVSIILREENFGLAKSIITGVTEIVNKYGRIIVMEDDLLSSPFFLSFMNDALRFYNDEEKVISIQGYIYPLKGRLPEAFFIKGADCLGWATWKRGWDIFERDGKKLLEQITACRLSAEFNFNGTYGYTRMLKDQINGKNDSWAIRWYASAFLCDKLILYPGKSLIRHIGNDGSGTNFDKSDILDVDIINTSVKIKDIPIVENSAMRKKIEQYFEGIRPSLFNRCRKKLKEIFKKKQFSPGLVGIFINPFYFARASLNKNIASFSSYINGNVLDIGCGQKPYKDIFSKATSYVGLEIKKGPDAALNKRADIFYDSVTFPFKNDCFDSAVTFETLEHIFNPDEFLSEIHRVLKNGGTLLMTCPFIWDEHEQPGDYARYTFFGLKYLLNKHGFVIVANRKSLSDVRAIFQLINVYLYKVIRHKNFYLDLLLTMIFISPLNVLGEILSKILCVNNSDFYIGNIVLSKKANKTEC
jgi:SAM-dependent methyltransferase